MGAPQELFSLAGKVAIVTGGSRGLGREIVCGFARAGADVVIASRKLSACQEVAEEVCVASGHEALAVECNTGNWSQVQQLADAAFERFGQVDVLVNNAGISLPYDGLEDVSEGLFDKMLAVNLKGPFRLTSIIGKRMMEQGSGSIIMISSSAAANPESYTMVYGASKAALNTLAVGFARAFAPLVRVNTIGAGAFFTDMWRQRGQEEFREFGANRTLLGRGGDPSEIVGTAIYLASDASSFTTGSLIPADGGPVPF